MDDGLHGGQSAKYGARYVNVDAPWGFGEDNTKAGVPTKADAVLGQWIESGPHLMLMPKDPATLANYPADFTTGAPYVMFPGTPYAHLMIR